MESFLKKEIDLHDILMKLLLIFPISTVIQGISIFSPINKILICIVIALLFILNIKNIDHKGLIILIVSSLSSVLGIILCDNFDFNINNLFYFLFWSYFMIYIGNYKDIIKINIKSNKNCIYYIILLWTIIVFISLFFETSFPTMDDWGGERYFISFSDGVSHRFASSCFMIIALTWILYKFTKKTNHLLFIMLPFVSIFLTGARIYLLIGIALVGCIYYTLFKNKKYFWQTLIPIGILLIVGIMITPMGDKIINTLTEKENLNGMLETFTNGRSFFWVIDLKKFYEEHWIYHIIGRGVSFVFDVNKAWLGMNIYAHNDFINILLTYGYIGITTFVGSFIYAVKEFLEKETIISKLLIVGFIFICFINAFLNGLYSYPCAMISIPFILYSIIEKE